jgi:hypothetical protein
VTRHFHPSQVSNAFYFIITHTEAKWSA